MSAFIDFRSKELKSSPEFDICIIGAGAAGITIARQLAKSGLRLCLVESGGMEMDGATQALQQGPQEGIRYYDLAACRLRFFGGTTNHWSGYCRENDPIDYEDRSDMGVPAWPVQYEEVSPYVKKAATELALPVDEWDPARQIKRYGLPESQLVERHSQDFETKVFQVTKRKRFRPLYHEELAKQENLTVITYANAVKINVSDDGKTVTGITLRAINGHSMELKGKRFVLAAHAIENARLLLESDDRYKNGIGNQGDHVGRHFMEHVYVHAGLMIPTDKFPVFYDAAYAPNKHADVANINANLSLSESALRREKVLQYYCRFLPIYPDDHVMESFTQLTGNFWKPADLSTIEALGNILGNIPASSRFAANKLKTAYVKPIAFQLDHRIEQAPNPDSRITLEKDRDQVGVRKPRLHWHFNDLDYKTFMVGQSLVEKELTRLGWGAFKTQPITETLVRNDSEGHYHHIGTTRMSDSAKDGVVDRNCKVHGLQNLYVAGSSIFPTAGYSGPTMMLVAFAIRLAEHLQATHTTASHIRS